MLRPTFQLAFAKSIAFAAGWSLVLLANVFGQNAQNSKCAADDYGCEIGEYTAAIKSQPKDYKNYYSRGRSYIYLKNYEAALQDYNKVIDLNPKSDEAYSGRGYVYQVQGRYAEAMADFNKAIELNPNNTYAIDARKSVFSLMRRNRLTVVDYSVLIEAEPNNAEYYYERSNLYFNAKIYDNAIEDSSKAIELNPKYTSAYGVRSDSYCQIGKWKESTADIKTYEQLKGRSSGAVCYINLFKSLKNCVETDTECKMAVYNGGIDNPGLIDSPPGVGDFYAGRGIIYYKSDDLERAFSDFDSADKHLYRYKFEPIELYLGKKAFIKGLYDEALKHFISAAEVKKESAEAYLGIGEIYLIKREYEKSLENYEKALFLNPRLSNAYLGRGTISLEYGKIYGEFENNEAKAVEAYKNAVKNFDSVTDLDLKDINPEVYLRRAKAYEKLGEAGKAANDRATYQKLSEKP